MTTLDSTALLERILTGAPQLAGRACANSPQLFDPADEGEPLRDVADRHAIAIDICHDCPALAACRRWVDELPAAAQPAGVVAGAAPHGISRARRRPAA